MDMTLRWQGPWESEDLNQIPEGHEILAEFPSVVWAGNVTCINGYCVILMEGDTLAAPAMGAFMK